MWLVMDGWLINACSCPVGQPARSNHAESTDGKQRPPHEYIMSGVRIKGLHGNTTRIYIFTHFELYPLSKKVPSLHIGPDPALSPSPVSPPPPPTGHRRASVVKWKLYIACRCEIECVCHLCVSSVMEWQHVQGLPVSSHTVHSEIIMTSLWPWGAIENGIMDEILEKTECWPHLWQSVEQKLPQQCTRALSFKRKKKD